MPWYGWLVMAVALSSILGGLFWLRDSAKPLPLNEEQLARIKQRNLEQNAKDAQD